MDEPFSPNIFPPTGNDVPQARASFAAAVVAVLYLDASFSKKAETLFSSNHANAFTTTGSFCMSEGTADFFMRPMRSEKVSRAAAALRLASSTAFSAATLASSAVSEMRRGAFPSSQRVTSVSPILLSPWTPSREQSCPCPSLLLCPPPAQSRGRKDRAHRLPGAAVSRLCACTNPQAASMASCL